VLCSRFPVPVSLPGALSCFIANCVSFFSLFSSSPLIQGKPAIQLKPDGFDFKATGEEGSYAVAVQFFDEIVPEVRCCVVVRLCVSVSLQCGCVSCVCVVQSICLCSACVVVCLFSVPSLPLPSSVVCSVRTCALFSLRLTGGVPLE
jgi:hypothetical protein